MLLLDDALPADAAILFVLEDRSLLAVGGEEHPIELWGPENGVLDALCPLIDIFPMADVNTSTIMSFASSYSPVLSTESRFSLFIMFRGES